MNIQTIINLFIMKLELSSNNIYSWESTICSLVIMLISFGLFIFWTKQKAIINFRSWSLLMTILNIILTIHYCPIGPHLSFRIGDNGIRFLFILQFITSAVTIFKLWKISNKYLPKKILHKKSKLLKIDFIQKIPNDIKMKIRLMAVGYVLKNGGNHIENDKKLSKHIENTIKMQINSKSLII